MSLNWSFSSQNEVLTRISVYNVSFLKTANKNGLGENMGKAKGKTKTSATRQRRGVKCLSVELKGGKN